MNNLPKNYFACILADPPWQYKDKASPKHGRCPYPTMPVRHIARLPVEDLAAEDAFLFLWVTNSFLIDGTGGRICEAWGFQPKTLITWHKLYPGRMQGLGHYTRNETEHIILAVRGKPKRLVNNMANHFEAPVGRHSAKPEESFQLIEAFCDGPRLELFARKRRPGWEAWGNEV